MSDKNKRAVTFNYLVTLLGQIAETLDQFGYKSEAQTLVQVQKQLAGQVGSVKSE